MRLPSIAIVTCSFQQRRFLESTLRSVLEQDYPRLEYLVVDGGSLDGSAELIRHHAARLAWWVSESDRGQTDALIKGFAHSSGEIMGWLCSDDLLLPGALRAVGEFFAANPQVEAMYGDSLWIDEHGRFIRPKREMAFNRFVFLCDHNYIPQPSMFWRRSLYQRVGGLDARFDLAMDGDLWERFSRGTRIAHLPRYLSCMRHYDKQKTRSRRDACGSEDAEIRRRGLPMAGRPALYPALRSAARALRIALKACAGGYRGGVPQHHLRWLEQRAGD